MVTKILKWFKSKLRGLGVNQRKRKEQDREIER